MTHALRRARIADVEERETAAPELWRPGHEQIAVVHRHQVVMIDDVLVSAVEERAVLEQLVGGERLVRSTWPGVALALAEVRRQGTIAGRIGGRRAAPGASTCLWR